MQLYYLHRMKCRSAFFSHKGTETQSINAFLCARSFGLRAFAATVFLI